MLSLLMKVYDLHSTDSEPVSHDPNLMKRVLFRQGTVTGLKHLSHILLEPGQTVETHSHPDATEVFYCISGSLTMNIAGEDVIMTPGICVVVEPGDTHSISKISEPTELLYFMNCTEKLKQYPPS